MQPPALPASREPVLLVAGIHDTSAKMASIDRYLVAKGWAVVDAVTLVPSDGSVGLDSLAQQLQREADALRTRTHSERVDLVAFSMGGIVSRYYLQHLGGAQYVRHFVTVSSPHHGSLIADLGWGTGVAQMRPNSAFLADLNTDTSALKGITCTSIWTPFDLMVVPAASSRVDWATNEEIPVLLHPWMVSDPRVLEAIAAAL